MPSNAGPSHAGNAESGQVRIKSEPSLDPQPFQTNGLPPNYGNNIARERAMQNIQQKFGSDAQLQINRLQQQSAMNAPPAPPSQRSPMAGQFAQGGPMNEKRADLAEYHRLQGQTQSNMKLPSQQQPVANNAQTDGAGDWDAFVSQRRQSPEGREGADLTIRQRLEQAELANEGGGLLLPVSEQRKKLPPKSDTASARPSRPSQFDGVDEDEDIKADTRDDLFDDDEDADAINSELDDPDDNAIEEEQDEGRPNQVMLCTYDKVQRVKNKWKCTLKDGVLNTGGKECAKNPPSFLLARVPPLFG